MKSSDRFVTLVEYVTPQELQVLKSRLNSAKVNYIVIGQGATTGYEDEDYYIVRVAAQDLDKAKPVVNKFRATTFIKNRRCPKCKSPLYESVTNFNFFQKIWYWGTTPVRCKKCKTIYPI